MIQAHELPLGRKFRHNGIIETAREGPKCINSLSRALDQPILSVVGRLCFASLRDRQ
jgi:hypothetical protein